MISPEWPGYALALLSRTSSTATPAHGFTGGGGSDLRFSSRSLRLNEEMSVFLLSPERKSNTPALERSNRVGSGFAVHPNALQGNDCS